MTKVVVLGSLPHSLINFRKALLLELKHAGYSVVAAAGGVDSAIETELKKLDIPYRSAGIKRNTSSVFHAFYAVRTLYRLLREEKPDVLFSYTIQPVLLGSAVAWFARVPRIYSMITGVGSVYTRNDLKTRLMRTFVSPVYKFSISRNDRIIFQNQRDRQDFLKWGLIGSSTPTAMVPSSGLDTRRYAQTDLPPIDRIGFVFLARFIREKGIVELLEAATLLRKRGLDFTLDIVGGSLGETSSVPEQELAPLIESSGAVRHEWSDDVREFIRRNHVLVLPTYREGAPRSVLEAMSIGRAIITTRAPGAADVVEENVNAILVEPRDSLELADAMQYFIDNSNLIETYAKESVRIINASHKDVDIAMQLLKHMDLDTETLANRIKEHNVIAQ